MEEGRDEERDDGAVREGHLWFYVLSGIQLMGCKSEKMQFMCRVEVPGCPPSLLV